MIFIEMTEKHLKEASKLFSQAFNTPPWKDCWTPERAEKRLELMLSNNSASAMVVLDDHEYIVGMILGDYEYEDTKMAFQIKEFCVDVKHKGKGIGTRLLDEMTEHVKKNGVEEIILMTLRAPETHEFYKSLGYSDVDEWLMMHKEL